jgi:TonB family protein
MTMSTRPLHALAHRLMLFKLALRAGVARFGRLCTHAARTVWLMVAALRGWIFGMLKRLHASLRAALNETIVNLVVVSAEVRGIVVEILWIAVFGAACVGLTWFVLWASGAPAWMYELGLPGVGVAALLALAWYVLCASLDPDSELVARNQALQERSRASARRWVPKCVSVGVWVTYAASIVMGLVWLIPGSSGMLDPDPVASESRRVDEAGGRIQIQESSVDVAVARNQVEFPHDAMATDGRAVDADPEYTEVRPAPRYPPQAVRRREEGEVMLRVLVDASGSPGTIEMAQSSGSPRLDGAAVEAVRQWRFAPGVRNGQPVEGWVLVPISFKLTDA